MLLSGHYSRAVYDEVNNMREYTQKAGVPRADIFMDHAGLNMYETVYRAKHILKVDNAIISTKKSHLARSIYLSRDMGIKSQGMAASSRVYKKIILFGIWEITSRCKAFLQLEVLHSKPMNIGREIPIMSSMREDTDDGK